MCLSDYSIFPRNVFRKSHQRSDRHYISKYIDHLNSLVLSKSTPIISMEGYTLMSSAGGPGKPFVTRKVPLIRMPVYHINPELHRR